MKCNKQLAALTYTQCLCCVADNEFYRLFCRYITAQIGPRPPRFEVSKLHTIRHTHPVELLWTSDMSVAEADLQILLRNISIMG